MHSQVLLIDHNYLEKRPRLADCWSIWTSEGRVQCLVPPSPTQLRAMYKRCGPHTVDPWHAGERSLGLPLHVLLSFPHHFPTPSHPGASLHHVGRRRGIEVRCWRPAFLSPAVWLTFLSKVPGDKAVHLGVQETEVKGH